MTNERRGSPEETRRILQEIEKINHSLGYRRRPSYAFPRVSPPSPEGYFYPRQTFRPEFLTKPKTISVRFLNQRAINPLSNQNYFYPTPYLQTPQSKSTEFYPFIYAPINFGPIEVQKAGKVVNDGSVKLGTIIVLPEDPVDERESKAISGLKKAKQNKLNKKLASLLDSNSSDEDDDAERQESKMVMSTARVPMVKNDKYMNFSKMTEPQFEAKSENYRPPPPLPHNLHRAFNFSSSIEKIQNFTKRFTTLSPNEKSEGVTDSSLIENTSILTQADIEEEIEEKIEDKEDEKSPFGLLAFGPKQQLSTFKEGGLIIQRLRVRQGGIAIAGPGGVATVNNRKLI